MFCAHPCAVAICHFAPVSEVRAVDWMAQMKEPSQFGEIPPLLWPGQSRCQHTLPHAREEAVECWGSVTHNAYIITHYAYIARIRRGPFRRLRPTAIGNR